MLIINKDDLEFVIEFPCLLGHPVYYVPLKSLYRSIMKCVCVCEYLHWRKIIPLKPAKKRYL